jgi:acetyl esterase/lipase
LKLLPKAYFLVLEWDTLKDQCLIYAERLKSNNVPVEVSFYENGYHGMVPFIDQKGIKLYYYLIIEKRFLFFQSILADGYELSRKMLNDLVKYIQENF